MGLWGDPFIPFLIRWLNSPKMTHTHPHPSLSYLTLLNGHIVYPLVRTTHDHHKHAHAYIHISFMALQRFAPLRHHHPVNGLSPHDYPLCFLPSDNARCSFGRDRGRGGSDDFPFIWSYSPQPPPLVEFPSGSNQPGGHYHPHTGGHSPSPSQNQATLCTTTISTTVASFKQPPSSFERERETEGEKAAKQWFEVSDKTAWERGAHGKLDPLGSY